MSEFQLKIDKSKAALGLAYEFRKKLTDFREEMSDKKCVDRMTGLFVCNRISSLPAGKFQLLFMNTRIHLQIYLILFVNLK